MIIKDSKNIAIARYLNLYHDELKEAENLEKEKKKCIERQSQRSHFRIHIYLAHIG